MNIRIGIGIGHNSGASAPVDIIAPTLSGVAVAGQDVSGIMSEAGKLYMIWEAAATTRTKGYVKTHALANDVSLAAIQTGMVAGNNTWTVDDSALSGAYYIKMAPEDLAGNIDSAGNADQVGVTIGSRLTLIHAEKVTTPTATIVVAIPSSGSFMIGVSATRGGATQAVTGMTPSSGLTLTTVTDGTLGDTGSIQSPTGSFRAFVKWIGVTATQAGTVTITITGGTILGQSYVVWQLLNPDFSTRDGAYVSNGGTSTGGQDQTVLLPGTMAAHTLLLGCGVKYQTSGDAAVTFGPTASTVTGTSVTNNATTFSEFLRNGDAGNCNFVWFAKLDTSGTVNARFTYSPLGWILHSAIGFTVP